MLRVSKGGKPFDLHIGNVAHSRLAAELTAHAGITRSPHHFPINPKYTYHRAHYRRLGNDACVDFLLGPHTVVGIPLWRKDDRC